MFIRNKLLKLRWLAVIVLMMTAVACSKSDDNPNPDNNNGNGDGGGGGSDVAPSITAMSITNAGENGDQTVVGTVDENEKSIKFDAVDPKTDLSAVQFDATITPDGAKLKKSSYDFGFTEGDTKKTIAVTAVNGSKEKQYLATIELAVPKSGADFDNAKVYDFTGATEDGLAVDEAAYPDFNGMLVRGSGFDGEHVLIVSRDAANGNGPFLLSVDDIMDGGGMPSRISLDLTGVSGGIYTYNGGVQVHGHTYVCNLATSDMRLYHWDGPSATPEVIYQGNFNSPFSARFGDYMSASIDENGNGFIYFSDNSSGSPWGFGKLTISNFNEVTDTTYFEYPDEEVGAKLTYTASFNRVDNSDKYLVKGYDSKLLVTDASGNVANATFELPAGSLPAGLSDVRAVKFNDKRYLIGATTYRHETGENTLYVYDITDGNDIVEALTNFSAVEDKKPVYKYSLQGAKTIAPGTRTGAAVVNDKLLLYAAGTDVGFVVIEVPKDE